jgi:hypothetical protein
MRRSGWTVRVCYDTDYCFGLYDCIALVFVWVACTGGRLSAMFAVFESHPTDPSLKSHLNEFEGLLDLEASQRLMSGFYS